MLVHPYTLSAPHVASRPLQRLSPGQPAIASYSVKRAKSQAGSWQWEQAGGHTAVVPRLPPAAAGDSNCHPAPSQLPAGDCPPSLPPPPPPGLLLLPTPATCPLSLQPEKPPPWSPLPLYTTAGEPGREKPSLDKFKTQKQKKYLQICIVSLMI